MAAELILRPDLGKGAYRLRCRFTVDSAPTSPRQRRAWEHTLEKMKRATAKRFVADMDKQGWEYVDKYGFRMSGPYHPVQPVDLRRLRRQRFNARSPDFRQPHEPGPEAAVVTLSSLAESDRWDYELSAVFVHKTLLAEIPYVSEEQQELNKP